VVAAVLISIPTTYLVFTLETSYDFIGAMPDTEATEGLSAMGQGFGAGKITPTSVALQMQLPVMVNGTLDLQEMDSIEALSANLSAMSNVQKVTGPTRPLGELINYRNLSQYPPNLQAEYMALISTMLGKDDTRAVLMSVTFKAEPFAKASIDTINSMRDTCARINALDPLIVQAMVGGATASTYDISNLVQSDFNFMGMAVVIGIYLVLMVVLGSIISPIRSIVTILLSISWTIATTMVVFQFIQGVTIIWMIPMVLLVMCLGLGMDYDIFITTRIREEVSKGRTNEDAIVHAMEHTGGVITACGIIMAGTFGSLMLSNGALLREFGFALMFAILLDATIVRIYLVPAIVSLLGKWNWYAPGRLQRVGREEKMAALKAKDPEFSVEAREGEGTDPPKR
jgi:RND superfamily putative drug exporter